jgi:hypothetical protein
VPGQRASSSASFKIEEAASSAREATCKNPIWFRQKIRLFHAKLLSLVLKWCQSSNKLRAYVPPTSPLLALKLQCPIPFQKWLNFGGVKRTRNSGSTPKGTGELTEGTQNLLSGARCLRVFVSKQFLVYKSEWLCQPLHCRQAYSS